MKGWLGSVTERGKYLVDFWGGHDCPTPKVMSPNGPVLETTQSVISIHNPIHGPIPATGNQGAEVAMVCSKVQFWMVRFFLLFSLLGWNTLEGAEPGYKIVDVRDGGLIRGTVRMSGSASDFTVPTGKDDKICGPAVLLSKLSTGRNGGVKNAVVYIEQIGEGKSFASGKKYLLDQKECKYTPHVTVLPHGAPLEIVNSDPVLHNVHISELGSGKASVVNIAQPIKGQRTVIQASRIRKPGFLVATCDAGHPWMSAYIMVAEHPYYSLTDRDGNYFISDIPPGDYRLVMWHEGVRVSRIDSSKGKTIRYDYEEPYMTESLVSVQKGKTTRADFQLQLR